MYRDCRTCGQSKAITDYQIHERRKNADSSISVHRRWHCSECRNHSEKLKRYGIDQKKWEELCEDYSCKICGTTEELVIDHCHDSGRVRGLLCGTCNKGLGLFYDKQNLLNNAIQYLDTY